MSWQITLLLWLLVLSFIGMVGVFFFTSFWTYIKKILQKIYVQKKVREVIEKKHEEQNEAKQNQKSSLQKEEKNHLEENILLGSRKNIGFGKKVPGDAISLMRKGEAMIARKDFDEAKKIFLKVLAWDDENIDASSHLAYSYLQTGEYTKAEVLFKKVLDATPNDPILLTNYALCLFEMKDPTRIEESTIALQQAAEIDPNNAGRQSHLGQSLFFLGDLEGALSAFKKAIKLEPRNAEYHFFLADTYLAMGEKTEARKVFEHIVDIHPLNREAKSELRRLVQEGF